MEQNQAYDITKLISSDEFIKLLTKHYGRNLCISIAPGDKRVNLNFYGNSTISINANNSYSIKDCSNPNLIIFVHKESEQHLLAQTFFTDGKAHAYEEYPLVPNYGVSMYLRINLNSNNKPVIVEYTWITIN